MSRAHQTLFDECEMRIRVGQVPAAAKRLGGLSTASLPRRWRLPFANLCRRSGLVGQGLKILMPVISSPTSNFSKEASPQELAEYAILLQRCGAVREALSLLGTVDPAMVPDVFLFRSFCHFNLWDYAAAVPELKSYIATALTPYAAFVGQVNLAAALVATGHLEDAQALLLENRATAVERGYHRLLANCSEMLGQVAILRGDYQSAEKHLGEAGTIFAGAQTLDQLFVKSWQAYLAALKTGNLGPLDHVRDEAVDRRRPESVRELDLMRLQLHFDQAGFDYLYFGTPFRAFRDRMLRTLNRTPSAEHYLLGIPNSRMLDLANGDGATDLVCGGKIHRLLQILLKDFYKPVAVGAVFGELFPGEHFNIFSSPLRVRQIVHRTRAFMLNEKIPAQIEHQKGGYTLQLSGDFAFRLHAEQRPADTITVQIERLEKRFAPGTAFSSKEACRELGLSPAVLRRVLGAALDKGTVRKFGASTRTVYYFPEAA